LIFYWGAIYVRLEERVGKRGRVSEGRKGAIQSGADPIPGNDHRASLVVEPYVEGPVLMEGTKIQYIGEIYRINFEGDLEVSSRASDSKKRERGGRLDYGRGTGVVKQDLRKNDRYG